MAGVNKVILIGNLGSDPEVRHLSNGSVVANFNIATSETYTNRDGQRVTQTEWHRIELWDGLAKIAEQYLRKGQMVYIEGKLRTETWQDKDGNNRTTTRIRGLNMTMLGSRNTDQPAPAPTPEQHHPEPMNEAAPEAPAQTSSESEPEDDLPF